jgi:hypothetical protein
LLADACCCEGASGAATAAARAERCVAGAGRGATRMAAGAAVGPAPACATARTDAAARGAMARLLLLEARHWVQAAVERMAWAISRQCRKKWRGLVEGSSSKSAKKNLPRL